MSEHVTSYYLHMAVTTSPNKFILENVILPLSSQLFYDQVWYGRSLARARLFTEIEAVIPELVIQMAINRALLKYANR